MINLFVFLRRINWWLFTVGAVLALVAGWLGHGTVWGSILGIEAGQLAGWATYKAAFNDYN